MTYITSEEFWKREFLIDSLNNELDGCYRDLAYYESIGHQSRIDEVERVIASIKKQIEEAE